MYLMIDIKSFLLSSYYCIVGFLCVKMSYFHLCLNLQIMSSLGWHIFYLFFRNGMEVNLKCIPLNIFHTDSNYIGVLKLQFSAIKYDFLFVDYFSIKFIYDYMQVLDFHDLLFKIFHMLDWFILNLLTAISHIYHFIINLLFFCFKMMNKIYSFFIDL